MAAARLSLVTLGVTDVDRLTNFYLSLGFERSSASVDGEVTFFHMAGSVLALYGREDLAADADVAADGSGFRGVSLSMNFDSASDVDTAFEAWREAGAVVRRLPSPTAWGGYVGYLSDPDGHLWELAHNPGFPFLPDGRIDLPR